MQQEEQTSATLLSENWELTTASRVFLTATSVIASWFIAHYIILFNLTKTFNLIVLKCFVIMYCISDFESHCIFDEKLQSPTGHKEFHLSFKTADRGPHASLSVKQ